MSNFKKNSLENAFKDTIVNFIEDSSTKLKKLLLFSVKWK